MTQLIVLTFLVVFGLASPGIVGVSPEGMYEAGLRQREAPPCRELTAGERRERHLDAKGKASTFSVHGEFLCERNIFDHGERDSYADFVVSEAGKRATSVARQIAQRARDDARVANRVWIVETKANPSYLARRLKRVYQQALSEALGPGAVLRGTVAGPGVATLRVETRAVHDVDILFDVVVSVPAPAFLDDQATRDGGGLTWRL